MFKLFVATPEKVIFDGEVLSVIVPGTKGYFEVLTNHSSLLSTLNIGKLTITTPDKKKSLYALNEGYIEVFQNMATILADSVESGKEIDIEKAENARKRARRRIHHHHEEPIDLKRAYKALKKAENRVAVYQDANSSQVLKEPQ